MNYFKFGVFAALLPCGLSALSAHANPLTLGASVIYNQSPYKKSNGRYYPFPIINYEGDSFYVHSLSAGYYLWKDPENQLSLTLLGSPQHFSPGNSDDRRLKALKKRHMTMMGGVSYSHTEEWGTVRTVLAGDLLDNSNGFLWDTSYLYRFQFGDVSLTPGIGVLYSSDKQNDYYYGVSKKESRRSGLNSYNADSSWNPYLELTAAYNINQNWHATVSGRYTRLSGEVNDSPMVAKNSQVTILTGISYTF